MQKELVISTTTQETKIAILEDDELVEYLIERDRSQGIVGNIYKGKVTKVLPGMQSALVDIGLERDAFLYVSDFFEDTEEYDKIVSIVEYEVAQLQEGARGKPPLPSPLPVPQVSAVPPAVPAEPQSDTGGVPASSSPAPEESIEADRPQAPPLSTHDDYRRPERDRGGR